MPAQLATIHDLQELANSLIHEIRQLRNEVAQLKSEPDKMLTASEAMALIGIKSYRGFYNWCKRKGIEAREVEGKSNFYYSEKEVLDCCSRIGIMSSPTY